MRRVLTAEGHGGEEEEKVQFLPVQNKHGFGVLVVQSLLVRWEKI